MNGDKQAFAPESTAHEITGLQVRFLHGALSTAFGLCGTDAVSAGLTTSLPPVNKITFPG